MIARHALLALVTVTACTQDSPGTSVRIALTYASNLALDTAEVNLGGTTKSTAISHELLLLVPDALEGQSVPLEIWGRSQDMRAARGTTTVMPVRDQTVAAALELTACAPRCEGDMLMGCGEPVTCGNGCSTEGDAHCITATPSNGVDATLADALTGTITITKDTTFDTDTGAVTNGLVRQPITGVDAGVGYYQAAASGPGGVPLGVFVFHDLTVMAGATVRFTGTRGAVVLVGNDAALDGAIEVSGGLGTSGVPGPGGGAGQTDTQAAGGCGPGGAGGRTGAEDGGGGGGGGGQQGGEGGRQAIHGASGPSCLAPLLEPLAGGSGGGKGSPGNAASTAGGGGGGGGALQVTVFGRLEIAGTINAGGAGGDPGSALGLDDGGGGGGGAGGGILLEAPTVLAVGGSVIAANGGGGGGGGGVLMPARGENGGLSIIVANGGAGGETLGNGGTGGGPSAADFGSDGVTNGGGGGGGGGVIVVRSPNPMIMGITSPYANLAPLHDPK